MSRRSFSVAPGAALASPGDVAQCASGQLAFLAANKKLPRLVLIEAEFRANQRAAELDFVRALASEIEAGTLDGLARWRAFHQHRDESGAVLAIGQARGRKNG